VRWKMKQIVLASTRRNAGKTSLAIGLAKATQRRVGYMKPLGDRLLYRKKRLWDYDAALVTKLLGLGHAEEEISIGFERAKLRYMYDAESTARKLTDMARRTAEGKDLLIVEAGADLSAGASVHLDAIDIARTLSAPIILLASGAPDSVVDDVAFVKRRIDLSGVTLAGVVFNRIPDVQDFELTQLPDVKSLGLDVLGIIPYHEELTHVTIRFLADALFARVIAGEKGLDKVVQHIFVGAMASEAAMREPAFQKPNRILITSGDRSDMILAALDPNTSAIVLANNILPPPNIVAKATELSIPLLLIPSDTFKAAKQVDDLEPLLTHEETGKLDTLARLVSTHVHTDKIV